MNKKKTIEQLQMIAEINQNLNKEFENLKNIFVAYYIYLQNDCGSRTSDDNENSYAVFFELYNDSADDPTSFAEDWKVKQFNPQNERHLFVFPTHDDAVKFLETLQEELITISRFVF